jgi:hypothetical protein
MDWRNIMLMTLGGAIALAVLYLSTNKPKPCS